MIQKPAIPKGTRDFSPIEMGRRNYIFNTIRKVFEQFGFQQIETPAMENLSTLMGKYGEEGDKLLFKILNSGDFLKDIDSGNNFDSKKLTPLISEKGLRYDLTVPFARFVVQNRNDISFPFKRYQIQPVWRADRPQKGRYREFYQCDVDVIGSNSLLNEVELIQIIDAVFEKLGLDVEIKLNNRKILAGIAQSIGFPDKFVDITVAIDKLDKIGKQKVFEELMAKGMDEIALQKLEPVMDLEGNNAEKLKKLGEILQNSEEGLKGIEEMNSIFQLLGNLDIGSEVTLDLTLARGLNYYTGAIFEVAAKNVQMGSICGGGRYDNLTGIFGMSDVSGVGVSFGADRIYDVLLEKQLFPAEAENSTQFLLINFGGEELIQALKIANMLRFAGNKVEIYPDNAKMKKQMQYANDKKIPYVILGGSEELSRGEITLKNMQDGSQQNIKLEEISGFCF